MPKQGPFLQLKRCPYCNIAQPLLSKDQQTATANAIGGNKRHWVSYKCATCGGMVLTCAADDNSEVLQMWPEPQVVSSEVPERARDYLEQAIDSHQAPAGSVMLSAGAVDAMLKAKGFKEGSLYSRIDKAAEDHLITKEMADWAHQIRLGANAQRHADEDKPLPTAENAAQIIEFAQALAQFLFVLPARVRRGKDATKPENPPAAGT